MNRLTLVIEDSFGTQLGTLTPDGILWMSPIWPEPGPKS